MSPPGQPRGAWALRVMRGLSSSLEWLFGALTLLIALAMLAGMPLLQFLSLGYLLEASGRVARSGRIRDGFVGVRKAARVGSILLGTALTTLPVLLVADMWYSAYLIASDSPPAAAWRVALLVLTVLLVGNTMLAWYCGGRLRHFFWLPLLPLSLMSVPFRRRGMAEWFPPAMLWAGIVRGRAYQRARDAVWEFVVGLHLPSYFWLGLRGFAGAIVWLFLPIVLLIGGTKLPAPLAVLSGLSGGLLLALVLLYLPFLQTHFAAEKRLVAMFQVSEMRRLFLRAPIAFWFALLVTLLSALPLYLLKIEATPRQVVWLPSLAFVAFIFPARLLIGWSVARAGRHPDPRFFLFRWTARLAALPVVAAYVLIVFSTQYLSWYGVWSLFEQHAFLVPVPFWGL